MASRAGLSSGDHSPGPWVQATNGGPLPQLHHVLTRRASLNKSRGICNIPSTSMWAATPRAGNLTEPHLTHSLKTESSGSQTMAQSTSASDDDESPLTAESHQPEVLGSDPTPLYALRRRSSPHPQPGACNGLDPHKGGGNTHGYVTRQPPFHGVYRTRGGPVDGETALRLVPRTTANGGPTGPTEMSAASSTARR